MRLLVVEDNDEMRHLIRSVVGDLGTVLEIADGAEALAAYAKHLPDWVLMDVKMKEVDGISATRQIRAAYPCARIIIITDYDDADLRREAERAGACRYMLKDNLLAIRQFIADPRD